MFTVTNTLFTWQEARTYCRNAGGDLASIINASDQLKIDEVTNVKGRYWIGFNDRSQEGSFVWSDGSRPGCKAWSWGEPKDRGGADCTQLFYNDILVEWSAISCSRPSKSICKIPGKLKEVVVYQREKIGTILVQSMKNDNSTG